MVLPKILVLTSTPCCGSEHVNATWVSEAELRCAVPKASQAGTVLLSVSHVFGPNSSTHLDLNSLLHPARSVPGYRGGARRLSPYSSPRPAWFYAKILVLTSTPFRTPPARATSRTPTAPPATRAAAAATRPAPPLPKPFS